MRGSRALARASLADGEEGKGSLSLSSLGLRLGWADPTGEVGEALQQTHDEFAVRIGVLREAIGAIRALADDLHAQEGDLADILRGSSPDPEAIEARRRTIDRRREQIDRLARTAVNRLRRERRAKRS